MAAFLDTTSTNKKRTAHHYFESHTRLDRIETEGTGGA